MLIYKIKNNLKPFCSINFISICIALYGIRIEYHKEFLNLRTTMYKCFSNNSCYHSSGKLTVFTTVHNIIEKHFTVK